MAFDEERAGPSATRFRAATPSPTAEGDAIYPYVTKAGQRYRFVFRQSDGTLSSRRGFVSRRAAAAARRRLIESIDRGEITVCREDFETFWNRFAAERRAYLTAGSHLDLTTHGRKRLVPFFGGDQLSSIDPDRVRDWLAVMVELVEAGELSPKTVNNARTYLSVALNASVLAAAWPSLCCRPRLPGRAFSLCRLWIAARPLPLRRVKEHSRVECSVHAGDLSAKTVNNARTWLAVVFNEAVRRRLMPLNPCKAVPRLPHLTPELDHLRIGEIDRYLDVCSAHYRPLAEFLIGAGARISEALALTWTDVDLAGGSSGSPVNVHGAATLIFVARQLGHRSITTRTTA